MSSEALAISIKNLTVSLADRTILRELSLDVHRGEIVGVVGASGGGKSVLLRTILGLIQKSEGTIEVLGINLDNANDQDKHLLGRRCGTLFQQGALFSGLTVLQNVEFPMREYLRLPDSLRREVSMAKLEMVVSASLPTIRGSSLPSFPAE